MGPDGKKDGDEKVKDVGGEPERRRVAIRLEVSPGVTLSKDQVQAALDRALGPDHGVEAISITRTKGRTDIN